MKKLILQYAERLMTPPAVPYHEAAVADVVVAICEEAGLSWARDRFGNILVSVLGDAAQRPVVLAAHMDHPGFEVKHRIRKGGWSVQFLGGVPSNYFRKGLKVRLHPGNVPAVLGKALKPTKHFEVVSKKWDSQVDPLFATWDLIPFDHRGPRIRGRACDDVVGVATVLATLKSLSESRVHALGLISRAEEIGFQGALVAAQSGLLPQDALVISLETSKEIPAVKMGEGVIIRVGDKTSIFNSEATRFLTEVAVEMATRNKKFRFQKALMSGGTCEATAYQESGFQTAAVCVALGNYHNCAPKLKIAAEYVDVDDVVGMVELLCKAIEEMKTFSTRVGKLKTDLDKLAATARKRLSP